MIPKIRTEENNNIKTGNRFNDRGLGNRLSNPNASSTNVMSYENISNKNDTQSFPIGLQCIVNP